jgi:hypothetical protein
VEPAIAVAVALHPLDVVAGGLTTLGRRAQIVADLVYFIVVVSFSRLGTRFFFFFKRLNYIKNFIAILGG